MQLDEALRNLWGSQQVRLAVDAAGIAFWRWNVDTNDFSMDPHGFDLWGLRWSEWLRFDDLSAQIHPADRDRVRAAFVATRSVAGPFEIDFRIIVERVVRWISARGRGADEGIIGREMYGIFQDVTGRKQAEESHELLAGEMSHRVKNLLSIADSLTKLTSRSSKTVEGMTRDLSHRLTALGRAHNLVRPLPVSHGNSALLGDIIAVLLAPYDNQGAFSGRVRVAVPRTGIGEQSTNILAMVMHELATNAVKHGALSTEVGMLEVAGSVRGDVLELKWTETGGPSIDQIPEITGFGSKMIDMIVESELGGSITYDWRPAGLVATITSQTEFLSL